MVYRAKIPIVGEGGWSAQMGKIHTFSRFFVLKASLTHSSKTCIDVPKHIIYIIDSDIPNTQAPTDGKLYLVERSLRSSKIPKNGFPQRFFGLPCPIGVCEEQSGHNEQIISIPGLRIFKSFLRLRKLRQQDTRCSCKILDEPWVKLLTQYFTL